MIQDNCITNSDFPSLFNAADQASLSAQGKYLLLIRSDLAILVASAIMSSWSPNGPDPLAIPSAILATVGIFITGQLSSSKLERVWFDARAVAESVKSLTWRYIAASDPFPSSLSDQNLDEEFLKEVYKVLGERKDIASELNTEVSATPQISEKMREIRALPVSDRRNFYLEHRVQDQLNWYRAKATYNRKARSKWFNAIIASQALSLIAAILHAVFADFPVNGTGFFAGLATAFLSWLQVKRHQDLSQSYALAAQELGSIESLGRYVTSDESLSNFVSQAEEAISREHTLWVVKRSG
ncbi:membrane protein [Calothrix sp. PCC 7716]|nr:membrane protein [Calothrix sp. PCC 7716]